MLIAKENEGWVKYPLKKRLERLFSSLVEIALVARKGLLVNFSRSAKIYLGVTLLEW